MAMPGLCGNDVMLRADRRDGKIICPSGFQYRIGDPGWQWLEEARHAWENRHRGLWFWDTSDGHL